ncbi:unnamed protein product [Trichogramma brassicae]|uniref:Uncharacterized protein n=1 Tax=Trichogramma brassicae TaxID=86971 RepID=A0A6H5IAM0_9HYME|nr:unnamed protein product [Trichogramma brassicae]
MEHSHKKASLNSPGGGSQPTSLPACHRWSAACLIRGGIRPCRHTSAGPPRGRANAALRPPPGGRKRRRTLGNAKQVCRRAWVRSPLGEFSRFVFSPGVVDPVPEVERVPLKKKTRAMYDEAVKKTPITVRAGSDRITISRSPRRGLTRLAIDGAQHSQDEVRSENHTHKRAPDARTTLTRCSQQSNWGTCHRRQKREPHSQDGTRQQVLILNSGGDASNVSKALPMTTRRQASTAPWRRRSIKTADDEDTTTKPQPLQGCSGPPEPNHSRAAQRINVAAVCDQYKNLDPPYRWLADANSQAAIWVKGGGLVQERVPFSPGPESTESIFSVSTHHQDSLM